MNPQEQKSILSIALLAAFADGDKADVEREQIRKLAESLSQGADAPDMTQLYQDVLLKRIDLKMAAAGLSLPEHRQLAYEMAVCVCDADGSQSAVERQFLAALKAELALSNGAAGTAQADALGALMNDDAPRSGALATLPAVAASKPNVPEAEIEQSILNYAIMNGALELLPQSWASMAIIPMQVKMVYAIGKSYGHELDKGHIKEFIATVGVGMTSQYLEQFGRKLLGGLLGSIGGGLGRAMGGAATGVAFSFATTYALGQLAKRYYAGGRQMSTALLQETFQGLLAPAKAMQSQYLPQIQEKARSLDASKIISMVKGV